MEAGSKRSGRGPRGCRPQCLGSQHGELQNHLGACQVGSEHPYFLQFPGSAGAVGLVAVAGEILHRRRRHDGSWAPGLWAHPGFKMLHDFRQVT